MTQLYFRNIDGLRFFAFLIVLVSHLSIFTGYEARFYRPIRRLFLTHGDLGVSFFFTLSGFLITYLLFQERERSGVVSLRHFYIRRILRIWPVYLVVLVCGFFVFPHLIDTPLAVSLEAPLSRLPAYLFFAGNIDLVYLGHASVIVGILWSLAVEEQFYLVWPAVFKRVRASRVPWILGTVIAASFVYRWINADSYQVIHYMTFSVFSDLAIGCLFAYLVYFKAGVWRLFENLPRWAIVLNYALLLVCLVLRGMRTEPISGALPQTLRALESCVFCLLFVGIILEQCYSKHSLFKVGDSPALTYLGKISYGLCAYHMLAMVLVLWAGVVFFGLPLTHGSISIVIGIAAATSFVSMAFAHLSYIYMEKPVLRLKERVGYSK